MVASRTQYVGQLQRPGERPQNVDLVVEKRPVLTSAEVAAGIKRVDGRYDPGNVLRYFATGDGSTDDTAALQDAADVSHVHGMYLPKTENYYRITAAINLPDAGGVVVYGDGNQSMIRQATASANGINANTTGTRRSIMMRDFSIGVEGATTQGGTALNLENVTDSYFSNVVVFADSGSQGYLTGFRVYTLASGGAYRNEFFGCKVRTDADASAVGVLFAGATNESSNSNHWVGGQIRADSGIGVSIPDNGTEFSNQNVIMNTSFEGTTTTAVSLAGAQDNVIAFNRFEGPTTAIAFDNNSDSNVSLFNFYTSGVTPYSKGTGENFFLDSSTNTAVDRTLELIGGHYRVSEIQDVARAGFDAEMGTAAWPAFGTRVTSDSNMRLEVRVDGQMEWGPGNAVSDVGLRHQSGGILEVILGTFDANNKLVIDGGTSGQSITTGSGSPESSVTAPPGSLYTDTGGGAGTTLYVKESGTGNTGWVAK